MGHIFIFILGSTLIASSAFAASTAMNCEISDKQVYSALVDKKTGKAAAWKILKSVVPVDRQLTGEVLTLDGSSLIQAMDPRNCKSNDCVKDMAGRVSLSPLIVTNESRQRNLTSIQKVASEGDCTVQYGQSACMLKFNLNGEDMKFNVADKEVLFRSASVWMRLNYAGLPQMHLSGGFLLHIGRVDYTTNVQDMYYLGTITEIDYDCHFK